MNNEFWEKLALNQKPENPQSSSWSPTWWKYVWSRTVALFMWSMCFLTLNLSLPVFWSTIARLSWKDPVKTQELLFLQHCSTLWLCWKGWWLIPRKVRSYFAAAPHWKDRPPTPPLPCPRCCSWAWGSHQRTANTKVEQLKSISMSTNPLQEPSNPSKNQQLSLPLVSSLDGRADVHCCSLQSCSRRPQSEGENQITRCIWFFLTECGGTSLTISAMGTSVPATPSSSPMCNYRRRTNNSMLPCA